MKINVAQLKVAAENAIERAKEAQVEYDKVLEQKEREHFLAFKASLGTWRPFYETLGKALRKNATEADIKALTINLMPKGRDRYGNSKPGKLWEPFRRGTLSTHRPNWLENADHDLGPRPVYEVRNLENLIDFLNMVADEVVTTAALENAGFRNLAKLMDTVRNQHWTTN